MTALIPFQELRFMAMLASNIKKRTKATVAYMSQETYLMPPNRGKK